ncbi:MAG: hypothetical protein OJI67_02825 [Prosthecobacter sp.]|nr:hypothetical protein [Prosthecobacter sp.]
MANKKTYQSYACQAVEAGMTIAAAGEGKPILTGTQGNTSTFTVPSLGAKVEVTQTNGVVQVGVTDATTAVGQKSKYDGDPAPYAAIAVAGTTNGLPVSGINTVGAVSPRVQAFTQNVARNYNAKACP